MNAIDSLAEEPRPHACQILVVDDDPVNRLVAETLLEDLGFVAEVVASGAQALEAVARRGYDAILMDCQMPELDGYDTTRRIRQRESDGARTLVIAVTAHTSEAKRQKCLAAGMDDHVAKPLSREALRTVLGRWLPATRPESHADDEPAEHTPSPPDALGPKPLDAMRALGRRTGTDVVEESIGLFRREAPVRLDTMRRALDEDDTDQLATAAHSLGGSAVYLGASILAQRCRELVELARRGDLDECASRLEEVEEEHQRFLAKLGSV